MSPTTKISGGYLKTDHVYVLKFPFLHLLHIYCYIPLLKSKGSKSKNQHNKHILGFVTFICD
jgi:hypothetical protein